MERNGHDLYFHRNRGAFFVPCTAFATHYQAEQFLEAVSAFKQMHDRPEAVWPPSPTSAYPKLGLRGHFRYTDIIKRRGFSTTMIQREVLPNGVRIVTENITYVQSVALGIWVGVGARDEDDSVRGISHVIEHMLFKGTPTRNAQQIADEIDSVGGDINAFTSKENTCYYARILSEHVPLAVDVLTDMFLNSTLDAEEMGRELNVILEEIKRRDDEPDDLVHDLFTETLWPGHVLGKSVIGTPETVAALKPQNLRDYMARRYSPDTIVVAAAGNLNHEEIVEMVRARFGHLTGRKADWRDPDAEPQPDPGDGLHREAHRAGQPGAGHQRLLAARRREVHALHPRQRPGRLHEQSAVPGNPREARPRLLGRLLHAELPRGRLLRRLRRHQRGHGGVRSLTWSGPSSRTSGRTTSRQKELDRAKNQFRGSIVMGQESMNSRMMRIGRNELTYDRVIPIDEIQGKINAVTLDEVARVAHHLFGDDQYAMATVGPFQNGKAKKGKKKA